MTGDPSKVHKAFLYDTLHGMNCIRLSHVHNKFTMAFIFCGYGRIHANESRKFLRKILFPKYGNSKYNISYVCTFIRPPTGSTCHHKDANLVNAPTPFRGNYDGKGGAGPHVCCLYKQPLCILIWHIAGDTLAGRYGMSYQKH